MDPVIQASNILRIRIPPLFGNSYQTNSIKLQIGVGIGKFSVINSQELQVGKFGPKNREDPGRRGGEVSVTYLLPNNYRSVSVSVRFYVVHSEK